MAASMITIGSSTIIAPTALTKFPGNRSRTTVLIPIDGDVVTQRSNNRDSYGNKNAPRSMSWDLVPNDASSYDWTHTAETLKALEGTEVTLDTSTKFGYSASLSIMVIDVDLDWVTLADGVDWYSVTLSYTHH